MLLLLLAGLVRPFVPLAELAVDRPLTALGLGTLFLASAYLLPRPGRTGA